MTIDVLSTAARELAKAVAWYDSQQFGLGRDLINEAQAAVERLRPDPASWPEIVRHFRRVPLQRFPYSIIFRIDERNDRIVIVAFAHASRRPAYWKRRWSRRSE